MKYRTWIVLLILVIITVFLLSKVLITNNSADIKNINEVNNMKIESDVFINNGRIPVEYTCNGGGAEVPLSISGVPEEAKSLALLVDDPDAPSGDFVHWVVWNIDPKVSAIEGKPVGSVEGHTSLGKPGYVPPCPPSGVHHYYFKLYALDTVLSIAKSSGKEDLLRAMEGHILGSSKLVGLYGREM